MPRYKVLHKTTYDYGAPVIQSNHAMHLAPRDFTSQTIIRHGILVEPAPAWRSERVDYFGNIVTLISLESDHTNLSVSSVAEMNVEKLKAPDFAQSSAWEKVAEHSYHAEKEISQFTCNSPHIVKSATLHDFAREIFKDDMPVLEGACLLTEHIYQEFSFDNTATDISTPVLAVLEQQRGVCQDFAHLAISALRSLGLPVRYMSGYIVTHPPEGQERLDGSDATHAWITVWSPEFGWTGFDPTNNCLSTGGEHIAFAYGRDFSDVSPMSGVLLGGGDHNVDVAVDVIPAKE